MQCACYVINRLPPWLGKEKSPFEILYNLKPNVNYFRIFGSICYVHNPKANRAKFDPKENKFVFVGYNPCRKGWWCMDPETKKCVTSRDVVFDEVSSYYAFHENAIQGNMSNRNVKSLQLLPENDEQASSDESYPTCNISDVNENQVKR
ncbi:UNVERIFIED_CONTAM: hypothetical protein Scaly_0856600 [Sesamum calycinum]|uniref:Retroviral polymerase SH3-like domain-containing protein n=1 Tax=Sesamum calycinum TaxID=2727403 RepID=A0AAW2QUQ5_9LAMI